MVGARKSLLALGARMPLLRHWLVDRLVLFHRCLCRETFAAERADRGVALRYAPPISRTVLVALSVEVVLDVGIIPEVGWSSLVHEVVLTTSGHLLVLTTLIVSPVLCHLSASAFCNVMSCSLAKSTKFIVSPGWGSLGSSPFSTHHHNMPRESTVTTVSELLAGYVWLYLLRYRYTLRLIHPCTGLSICWRVHQKVLCATTAQAERFSQLLQRFIQLITWLFFDLCYTSD